MDGSVQGQDASTTVEVEQGRSKRERSSIGFPYLTLDEAVDVANAIHRNVGTGDCSDDQLAPWLSLSQKSSGYRLRISAAKMFGLIESVSAGTYKLTDLGRKVVDPAQERMAKTEAFLEVPLFNAVFKQYRGNVLPPAAALEREFNSLGVAQKQAGKARSSFERSAQSAGYFHEGRDRLVKPGFAETKNESEQQTPDQNKPTKPTEDRGRTSGGNDTRHPFIEGLLQTLPPSDQPWPVEGRVAWLKAAAVCFDLLYGVKGPITIEGTADEQERTAEELA